MAKRTKSKKQLKEEKRIALQLVRRRNGWKAPKGTKVYSDKY